MILRFTYHVLLDDLCAHYRRCGFRADRFAEGLVLVGRDDMVGPVDETHEAEVLLRKWEELHPEAPAQRM